MPPGAVGVSTAAPLGGTGPTAGGVNPQAILAGVSAPPPPPPALTVTLTSTVLGCSNMLTKEELDDTEEREALKEDVTEECNKVFARI